MAKILVADDEQKIREVIREYAEFNGHEVTEAADGMTAVGLCRLNDYDLIIMDIMMPKLDGFSVVEQLKSDPETAEIPVLAITAQPYPELQQRVRARRVGLDDAGEPAGPLLDDLRVPVQREHVVAEPDERVGRRGPEAAQPDDHDRAVVRGPGPALVRGGAGAGHGVNSAMTGRASRAGPPGQPPG